MAYKYDCYWFTGYKPCMYKRSCTDCPHHRPVKERILIISLEAMGAVLRSTCLLPAIKRQYPHSHISWITLPMSRPLLESNPLIDRLLVVKADTIAVLNYLEFDILYAVDKSLEAGALAELVQAKKKRGFGLTQTGVIRPLNEAASYQYQVGLDDNLKFYINQKPETQQLTETMELKWQRDPYIFHLSQEERKIVNERREAILSKFTNKPKAIIGYNTGCSILFPYKKFSLEFAVKLLKMWRSCFPDCPILLLGGPEDSQRQIAMKENFKDDEMVINTPTNDGLRSGILWIDVADIVLSGCSLGMHIAIALQKWVIAWFGVSCIQEVDLYERGVKLQAEVSCSPCWKKSCEKEVKCYDMVSLSSIEKATKELLDKIP